MKIFHLHDKVPRTDTIGVVTVEWEERWLTKYPPSFESRPTTSYCVSKTFPERMRITLWTTTVQMYTSQVEIECSSIGLLFQLYDSTVLFFVLNHKTAGVVVTRQLNYFYSTEQSTEGRSSPLKETTNVVSLWWYLTLKTRSVGFLKSILIMIIVLF